MCGGARSAHHCPHNDDPAGAVTRTEFSPRRRSARVRLPHAHQGVAGAGRRARRSGRTGRGFRRRGAPPGAARDVGRVRGLRHHRHRAGRHPQRLRGPGRHHQSRRHPERAEQRRGRPHGDLGRDRALGAAAVRRARRGRSEQDHPDRHRTDRGRVPVLLPVPPEHARHADGRGRRRHGHADAAVLRPAARPAAGHPVAPPAPGAERAPVQIFATGDPTSMWTYGGSYPGPTIVRPTGRATPRSPSRTGCREARVMSVHLHGDHHASADDGQPTST